MKHGRSTPKRGPTTRPIKRSSLASRSSSAWQTMPCRRAASVRSPSLARGASTPAGRRIVELETVPLDERELGVVPAAALGVAKYLADLIDIAAARRQQPFHGVF